MKKNRFSPDDVIHPGQIHTHTHTYYVQTNKTKQKIEKNRTQESVFAREHLRQPGEGAKKAIVVHETDK